MTSSPKGRGRSAAPVDLATTIVGAWQTTARVTEWLVAGIPRALWTVPVEKVRPVRAILAHLHNSRCGWIRTLGEPFGILPPAKVDPRRVTRRELLPALRKSRASMAELLAFGCAQGGAIPPSPRYVWRNLPLDVGHVLGYFSAHEGHHRGQIVMLARQLGQRLPREVMDGIWEWRRLSKKTDRAR